jgi:drug/metabolite transporter (DMT)-like permease
VIAVIGGSLTAIIWTIATLSSARASRSIGAPSTVAGVAFVGLLATIPLLATSPLPTAADLPHMPWLVVAGVCNIIGLLASYGALRRGRVSIVAPITSTEGAIAATLAILAGEPATAALLACLSLVVTGVVLTAYGPEGDAAPNDPDSAARKGGPVFLAMAVSSAVLFGVSLFAVGHASALVPAPWIIAAGRIFGVLFIALPLVLFGRLRMTREALPFVIVCGIAEVAGFLTVTWGSRDSIAITAVLSTQFAVLTVIISSFLGERVQRHQFAGAVLTGIGVAAVTVIQL